MNRDDMKMKLKVLFKKKELTDMILTNKYGRIMLKDLIDTDPAMVQELKDWKGLKLSPDALVYFIQVKNKTIYRETFNDEYGC